MHHQHSLHHRNNGFSLIEMAIILLVIGVILSMTIPQLRTSSRDVNTKKMKDDIQSVRDAIVGFGINANNCSLPTDGELDGDADADLIELTGDNEDLWGESFYYRVAPELQGKSGATLCAVDGDDVGFDVYEGTTLLGEHVAFFVASRGPNHNLEVTYDDTTTPPRVTVQPYGTDVNGSAFDDLYSFAKWASIKSSICQYCESSSAGGDVDFSDMANDFAGGGAVEDGSGGSIDTVVVDSTNGELVLRKNTSGGSSVVGCQWYTGTAAAGNCGNVNAGDGRDDGVCDFGTGVRVFFNYRHPGDTNGGFTFTLASVDEAGNINEDVTTMCGSTNDSYLGYSSNNGTPTLIIDPPKLGIEFDVYDDNPRGDHRASGLSADEANHIGVIFWGDESQNLDDNEHGATGLATEDITNPGPDTNITLGDGSNGIYDQATAHWFEDANTHNCRMEIVRDAGAGTVQVRIWWDLKASATASYNDLSNDLANLDAAAPAADIVYPSGAPLTHTSFGTAFNQFRFGWTMATSTASTDVVHLSNFNLTWR